MWRSLLGVLAVVWGLAAVAFLGWCQHRASFSVLLRDPAWPRPLPYPDGWLARWYSRLDAEHPAPPGRVKVCGEWYRLRSRLRAYTLSACAVVVAGLALVLWPSGRQSSRRRSVRRGVALGVVVGVVWASAVAHLNDEGSPPEWMLLAIYALGFAITGAAVGAARRFPELVGLSTGFLTVAALARIAGRNEDGLLFDWAHESVVRDFLAALEPGVDWRSFWPVVIGGCGLVGGSVIGALHRLSGPALNGEPVAPADRGR